MSEELAYKPIEKIGKIPIRPLQTEFAWLVDNSKRIISEAFQNIGGGSSTLYQVPASKLLYLTNITANGENTSATVTDLVFVKVANQTIFSIYLGLSASENLTFPLSMPLILEAGDKIEIFSGLNAKILTNFVGYEIDKKFQQNKKIIY
ncbi:MAG TPA: hypothetical protein ENI76_05435 [Ignavibacteria bacterium]|nr:hypothetical protein [Ignavibacteria bacterium]